MQQYIHLPSEPICKITSFPSDMRASILHLYTWKLALNNSSDESHATDHNPKIETSFGSELNTHHFIAAKP